MGGYRQRLSLLSYRDKGHVPAQGRENCSRHFKDSAGGQSETGGGSWADARHGWS